jgi:hypothetical protein
MSGPLAVATAVTCPDGWCLSSPFAGSVFLIEELMLNLVMNDMHVKNP